MTPESFVIRISSFSAGSPRTIRASSFHRERRARTHLKGSIDVLVGLRSETSLNIFQSRLQNADRSSLTEQGAFELQTRVQRSCCRGSIPSTAGVSVIWHVRVVGDFVHSLSSPIDCWIENVGCRCGCPFNPGVRRTAGWGASAYNQAQVARAVLSHSLIKRNSLTLAVSGWFISQFCRGLPFH